MGAVVSASLGVALAAARLRFRPWVVNSHGERLFVDPRDHRAWRLAFHSGALDGDAISAWRRLVGGLSPSIVIDVGANYGEVLLSTDYPRGSEVHAVEANQRVARHLRRSIDRSRTVAILHECAASSREGSATLTLDERSSGLSTLEPAGRGEQLTVPTRRLDRLVTARGGVLLVKVDVEGHEIDVLAGMSELLAAASQWCVLAEYRDGVHPGAALDGACVSTVHIGGSGFEPSSIAAGPPDTRRFTKDVVLSSTPLAQLLADPS